MSILSWFKSLFKVTEQEKVRAKDCKGRFVADDPSTPDVNEAWTTKKKAKKKPAAKKKKAKK
jgi:hypothetical protein|tara:strand:+ start:928 stop:1113 length:186 start_codon:yes stop_codon:yes gene_type:complete